MQRFPPNPRTIPVLSGPVSAFRTYSCFFDPGRPTVPLGRRFSAQIFHKMQPGGCRAKTLPSSHPSPSKGNQPPAVHLSEFNSGLIQKDGLGELGGSSLPGDLHRFQLDPPYLCQK